jgi:adenosylmethionine-8-amino-7-oxononanoate aminotransferase
LGLLVSHKSVKDINEVGTIEGVTSNADHSRLTKTCVCGLLDSLVSQGAWIYPGIMPILHSPGLIIPGQLGPISLDLV